MPQRRQRPADSRYPTGPQQAQVSPYEVQYIPQYDPGVQQMMAQSLQQRQQRYDQSIDMISESAAQFGQIPNISGQEVAEHVGMFTEELHDIASEYGGEYGMARAALSRRIAEESSNPFYQTAERQAQQAEIAQKAQLQYGADALVVNDPRQHSIQDIMENPELGQAEVYQAPNYGAISDSLFQKIQPEIKSVIGIDNVEELGRMIRQGQVSELEMEELARIARDNVDSFRTRAPGIEYDDRSGYEWTQSDEGIVDFLLSDWAGSTFKKEQYSWSGPPTPEETPPGQGERYIPTYASSAEVSDELSDHLKEAEELKTAVKTMETLPEVIDVLKDISAVDTDIAPDDPSDMDYDFKYSLSAEVIDRWDKGEGTMGDALKVLNARIDAGIMEGAVKLHSLGETVARFAEENISSSKRRNEILDIFTYTTDDITPEDSGYKKRGELLQLVKPIMDDLDVPNAMADLIEETKIVRDEDGFLTIDYPELTGQEGRVKGQKQEIRRQLALAANEQIEEGVPGLENQLKETVSQIEEYKEKYPAVEDLYEQFVDEGIDSGRAMIDAVDALTATQRRFAATHSLEITVQSTDPTSGTARTKEENAAKENLRELLIQDSIDAKKIEVGETEDEVSEVGRDSFNKKLTDSNIASIRLMPVEGALSLRFEGDGSLYQVDISDIGFDVNMQPKIEQLQNFIKQGINLQGVRGEEQEAPSVNLGGRTYEQHLHYNEQEQQFRPHIRVKDPDGNYLNLNGDKEFRLDYMTYIFTNLSS